MYACRGALALWVAGKKLPHSVCRLHCCCWSVCPAGPRLASRPRMSLPLKRVQPDPGSLPASCVILDDDAALPFFPGTARTPISFYPVADCLRDRLIHSRVRVNSSNRFSAFIQDVSVRSSVKGRYRNWSNRIALLIVEGSCYRSDGSDCFGQFAGQPVTHHPAVGEACDEDSSAVNVKLLLHLPEQRPD